MYNVNLTKVFIGKNDTLLSFNDFNHGKGTIIDSGTTIVYF